MSETHWGTDEDPSYVVNGTPVASLQLPGIRNYSLQSTFLLRISRMFMFCLGNQCPSEFHTNTCQ